jgi:lipoprotein-releasing system permease protein
VATLLLLVTEKGREIAVLKAMGASDGFITRVFCRRGRAHRRGGRAPRHQRGAGALSLMAQRVGIPLDPEVYYIERLPVLISPADYSLVFVTSGGNLPVGGDLPCGARGRLRPVEGLRFG